MRLDSVSCPEGGCILCSICRWVEDLDAIVGLECCYSVCLSPGSVQHMCILL